MMKDQPCIPKQSKIPCCLVTKSCPTLLKPYRLQPSRLLCPWNFLAKMLEWITFSYSRGSCQPRVQTRGSCIAGGFFFFFFFLPLSYMGSPLKCLRHSKFRTSCIFVSKSLVCFQKTPLFPPLIMRNSENLDNTEVSNLENEEARVPIFYCSS